MGLLQGKNMRIAFIIKNFLGLGIIAVGFYALAIITLTF
jgi:hypothetical protein